MNPFLATDGYKTGHHLMYPEGTTLVYSNFTPRSNRHANGIENVVSFGQQMVMRQIHEMFDNHFFMRDLLEVEYAKFLEDDPIEFARIKQVFKDTICQEIKEEYSLYLNTDYDVSHIEALWDLGFLPLNVKALPEGIEVPMGVPVLTIYNTMPEFYWLTNFLETLISNLLWKPITSASIAHQYKQNLLSWAKATDKDNLAFVEFQGHDFSMRGLSGVDSVIQSGLGHATSFLGSDSLPVIHGARKYYDEKDFVVGSVNATEHSVMSAGGSEEGEELDTFRYLMKQFPTGILSIVSDTWDLWKVITEYLPTIKEEILKRDGKIVIRPDSGDPVDIICGKDIMKYDNMLLHSTKHTQEEREELMEMASNDILYKGVVELLWDEFGGTINEQGYKVLDTHIGCIYGDSITLDRADDICSRLEKKGFASTNVVLGIGSFTYQFNTRDTFGFAMKATYVEIKSKKMDAHGKSYGREIFKDPITDDGSKKSAKGLLQVIHNSEEDYIDLNDQVSWREESNSLLRVIYKDGMFLNKITLTQVRERLAKFT